MENNVKKKKTNPIKGLFIALLIVFLIAVVGLLIRMVIADDGDYFKPIKDIFGIEDEKDGKEEKDDSEKEEKKSTSSKKGNSTVKKGSRYALLSDDVEGKKVKHYRMTIDMGEFFEKTMKETGLLDNLEEELYADADFDSSFSSSGFPGMMSAMVSLLSEFSDMIDGEVYFDIYFEGNEIIQAVFGYDYADFAENMYDYILDMDEDSLEELDIESFDDFLTYMNEQMEELLDEDTIYDALVENAGDEFEASLKKFGIKEKDIKDMIEFNCTEGIYEVYINGTTKLKAILSMALESEGFQENIKAMEKEYDTEIDEDNILESIFELATESDEYAEVEEYGMEFSEVK